MSKLGYAKVHRARVENARKEKRWTKTENVEKLEYARLENVGNVFFSRYTHTYLHVHLPGPLSKSLIAVFSTLHLV